MHSQIVVWPDISVSECGTSRRDNPVTLSLSHYLNNLIVHSDVLEAKIHTYRDGEIGIKLVLAFLFKNAGLANVAITYSTQ